MFSAALACTRFAQADQSRDALDVINHVSSALAAGDAADAITPFDKNMNGYDTLQNEFVGLAEAYQVVNEVDVIDEQDSPEEIQLTLQWGLTLSNKQTFVSTHKNAEVHVKMRLERRKWKIAEFTPVDLFS